MRTQKELGRVISRIALDLLDFHFGSSQRIFRLLLFRRVWIRSHILGNPFIEPRLHVSALFKGANFVAHDALKIMSETAGGEKVGAPRGEVGIGGRIPV